MNFREVKLTAPQPGQFEVPPGSRFFDSLPALMQTASDQAMRWGQVAGSRARAGARRGRRRGGPRSGDSRLGLDRLVRGYRPWGQHLGSTSGSRVGSFG